MSKRSYKKTKYKSKTKYSKSDKALYYAKKALSRTSEAELKVIDTSFSAVGIPNAGGSISTLTNMVKGLDGNDRIGDDIYIRSIGLRGDVIMNTTANSTVAVIMIIQDNQTNAALYTTAALLENTTAGTSVTSYLNKDNSGRFKVLYRKQVQLSDNGNQVVHINYFKECNIPINYNQVNGGTIADLTCKSLSIVMISNESLNEPVFTGNARLRFVDS